MTNHKTIEQLLDEYKRSFDNNNNPKVFSEWCFLAGAAKQKELLMPIIKEMKEALLRISHSDRMFNYPQHEIIHALLVEVPHEAKETLESIEEKLKGLG